MPAPELTLVAFAAAGIAAGPHCALMCGPLQGLQLRGPGSLQRRLILLHAGRVFAYTLLGAIAAGGGLLLFRRLPDPAWGMALQGLAAAVLLALGLQQLRGKTRGCCPPRDSRAKPLPLFLRGMILAAIPCPTLYAMLFIAMLSANPLYAALLMAAFGLGTLPLLGAGGALLHRARIAPARLRSVAAGLLILAGSVTVVSIATAPPGAMPAFCRIEP